MQLDKTLIKYSKYSYQKIFSRLRYCANNHCISWTITRIDNWESSFKRKKKEKKEAKRCCQGTTYPEYVTGFLKMAARRLSHAPNSWSMTFQANANAAPNFTLRGKNASSSASMKKNPAFVVTKGKCRSYRCSWVKPQTLFKQDLWLEKLNGSQDAPLTNEYQFNNGRMWKSQLVVTPEAHIKKKIKQTYRNKLHMFITWIGHKQNAYIKSRKAAAVVTGQGLSKGQALQHVEFQDTVRRRHSLQLEM